MLITGLLTKRPRRGFRLSKTALQEIRSPEPAHRGGTAATDRVGTNDRPLVGDLIWQPAGGMAGGDLQFDGVDDFVDTSSILDPAAEPFSAFAWIKGGALNRTILSQAGGKRSHRPFLWRVSAAGVGCRCPPSAGAGTPARTT